MHLRDIPQALADIGAELRSCCTDLEYDRWERFDAGSNYCPKCGDNGLHPSELIDHVRTCTGWARLSLPSCAGDEVWKRRD